jgi:hypothetical protein
MLPICPLPILPPHKLLSPPLSPQPFNPASLSQDNLRLPLALQTRLKVRSQHHGQMGVRLCWPTASRGFRHQWSGAIYGPGPRSPPIASSAHLLRGLRLTVVTSCGSSRGSGWGGGRKSSSRRFISARISLILGGEGGWGWRRSLIFPLGHIKAQRCKIARRATGVAKIKLTRSIQKDILMSF